MFETKSRSRTLYPCWLTLSALLVLMTFGLGCTTTRTFKLTQESFKRLHEDRSKRKRVLVKVDGERYQLGKESEVTTSTTYQMTPDSYGPVRNELTPYANSKASASETIELSGAYELFVRAALPGNDKPVRRRVHPSSDLTRNVLVIPSYRDEFGITPFPETRVSLDDMTDFEMDAEGFDGTIAAIVVAGVIGAFFCFFRPLPSARGPCGF